MQARQSVHRLVEFLAPAPKEEDDEDPYSSYISNACLSRGTDREVEIVDLRATTPSSNRKVVMTGADVGSFEGCKRIMELVMAKDAYVPSNNVNFNLL